MTVNGGSPPYTYLWNNGAGSSEDPTNLSANTYSVTVTDDNGCTTNASASVDQPTQLTASAVATDVSCFGGNDGEINLTVNGGSPPYTYLWNNGAGSSEDPTNLSANTYSVTVTDDNGCTTNASATVNQPLQLTGNANITSPILCYGETATIQISASGGTAPYTYYFGSSSNTNGIFSGITGSVGAGTSYNYYVTDANGCTTTVQNISVSEPPELTASASAPDVICNGGTTTVTITASGGTAPLSYTLNGVTKNNGTFAGITAGTYTWSVTDANSCAPVTGTIVITEPSSVVISSATVTSPITCNGGTATVTIVASGGSGTYSYSFNGQTNFTGIFTGVYAGTNLSYSVKDDNDCGPVFESIDIPEPDAISASAAVTSEIQCNGETATVTITASGGTGNLEYTFNGASQSSNIFTGITPGTNIPWSVTDANGCEPVAGTLTITQPNALTASVSETATITCNGGTADIRITASGGTGTKTYSFEGQSGNTTGEFTGIPAGTYDWSVVDNNGCFYSGTYEIQESAAVEITSIGSNSDICEGETLTLTSTAQGGTGNLSYSWTGPNGFFSNSPNPSIANATVAATGIYTLTVTDANGCSAQTTTDVVVYDTPAVIAPPSNQSVCAGDATSVITFSGATSYTWTNDNTSIGLTASGNGDIPSFTATNDGDTPVTATITITPEGNGCTGSPIAVTITVNPIPEVTITNNSTVLCDNGTTSIVLSSNVAGTTFSWSGDDGSSGSGNLIEEVISTTVTYTVTPTANGCTGDSKSTMATVLSDNYNLYTTVTSSTSSSILCSGSQFFIEFDGANPSSEQPSRFWGSVTRWETRFTWSIDNPNVTYNLIEEDMTLSSGISSNDGDDGRLALDIINNTNEDQQVTITVTPWAWTDEGYCVFSSCDYDNDWTQSCSGASFSKTITIRPFEIDCPADIVANTNVGDCNATLTPDPLIINCDPGTTTTWSTSDGGSGSGNISNYDFSTGTTTVTYRAQQSPSNFRVCTFTVTVTDDEAPVISGCPGNFNVPMDAGECGAVITWSDPTANDNCDGSLVLTRTDGTGYNSGDIFPAGTTTISYSVMDAAGNTSSCSFDITVAPDNEPPVFINCPSSSQEVCASAGSPYTMLGTAWNATVTDNCSGTLTKTYSLSGTTSGTGTSLDNVEFNVDTTTVTWTATDINGLSSTCMFDVVVTQTPAITADPVSQAVCLNGSVTFNTTASGTPNPTFQWYKDGVEITGETGTTLTINSLAETDAGSYTVEVSNDCGTAISAPAVLTVSTPPIITKQPASQSDCRGNSVVFSVVAAGGNTPYTYSWEMMRPSEGWIPASGEANITFPTSGEMQVDNTGNPDNPDQTQYRVNVSDACGNSVTSAIATLTVNEVKDVDLALETICQGEGTSFTAITSGSTPVSFEWIKHTGPSSWDPVVDGGSYSGATTATLTINNATPAESGEYSVRATFNITIPNNNGSNTCRETNYTQVGVLTVDAGPAIVATALPSTICPGRNVEIKIYDANGISGNTYTWTRTNTTTLPGSLTETTINDTLILSGNIGSSAPGTLLTTTFNIMGTSPNGCESTGTVDITVVDDEAPEVTAGTCPGDISVGADPGVCGAVVSYTPPTFDDNCDGAGLPGILVSGLASGETFPVGTTTVKYILEDGAENVSDTCFFDVTVTDDVDPSAVCKDITVQLDAAGSATITLADVDNGSSDNCGAPILSLDITSFDCTDLGANTVTLTATDSAGNIATCTANVTVDDTDYPVDIIVDSIVQTPIDCYGGSATVTVYASGGVGTLSYTLEGQTPNQTGVFNNIPAGSYSWSVTDPQHCGDTVSVSDFVVEQPGELNANISLTEVTCSSGDDGTITVIGSAGGSGDYEYQLLQNSAVIHTWQSDSLFANLSPGFYDIWMRDANATSCDMEIQANVEVYIITADISTNNITCFSGNDGSISISNPAGGTAPYQYSKDGGTSWQSSGDFPGLAADTFDVRIQDNDGCVVVLDSMVILTQPDSLDATLASTNVSCGGADDGTITISAASGGTGSYQYSIDGGSSWQPATTFSALAPGFYDVWIRDGSSCTKLLETVEITELPPLAADLDSSNITCFDGSDGTIIISNATGGSGSYEYSIDNGTTWQDAGDYTGLSAGTYQVFMRDSNAVACMLELDANLVLSQPDALVISSEPVDFADCEGATAQFSVANSAGVGTVTYTWQKENAGVWNDLANGGDISGANLATLQISNIELADTGLYRVIIEDDCLADTSTVVILTVNDIIALTPNVVNSEICEGEDFTFEVLTSGATPSGYQWQVNTSGTWSDISEATASHYNIIGATPADIGEYRVVVSFPSSAGTCSLYSDAGFERHLNVLPTPTVDSIPDFTYCEGDSPDPIPLSGSPGNVTFDLSASNYIGLFDQTNITSGQIVFPSFVTWGTATITITPKANGCTGTPRTFVIEVLPKPIFSAPPVVNICSGRETNIVLTPSNTDSIRYDWTVAVTPDDGTVSGWEEVTDSLATGIRQTLVNNNSTPATVVYTITPYKDGCAGVSNTVTVTVHPAINLVVTDPDTVCAPARVDLTDIDIVAGSTAGLNYEYYLDSALLSYVPGPASVNTGRYYIKATDPASGCYEIAAVNVAVMPGPQLTSTLTPTGICSNEAFSYIPTSDIPGTIFEWSRATVAGISNPPDSGTDNPDELLINTTTDPIPVVYTYTLTAGGCVTVQDVEVMVTPAPQLDNYSPHDICGGEVFSYEPTSSTGGTTFSWTRPAVSGISNPAASGTGNPNEVLNNTTSNPVAVTYYYTLTSNDCTNSTEFPVTVVVIPSPNVTASASPSEVCPGESVDLFSTSDIVGTTLPSTLLSENFNSASAGATTGPNGWTTTNNSSGGDENDARWTVRQNNYRYDGDYYRSNDNTNFYMTNSDAQGWRGDITLTTLVSPLINTVGYTSLTLDFYDYYNDYGWNSGDYAYIDISTNGGASWSTLNSPDYNPNTDHGGRTNFEHQEIDLTAYINVSNLRIRFRYTATYDWYWAIDNVTLSGEGGTEPEVHWTSVPAGFTSDVPNPTNVVVTEQTAFIATYIDPDTNCPGSDTVVVNMKETPDPQIAADYCAIDGKIELTALGGAAGASYLWSTGETSQAIVVDEVNIYSVTITNPNGCSATGYLDVSNELVINGDFEAGNTGFGSGYGYRPSWTFPAYASSAANSSLWDENYYGIGTNARYYHTNFWGSQDHTSGNGNFMIVNGNTNAGTAIWEQQVYVEANTNYYFSAWSMSLNADGNDAVLQFEVDGDLVGSQARLNPGQTNDGNNGWIRFYSEPTWNSGGTSRWITIRIRNVEPAAGGNDFALDDISFGTLDPLPLELDVMSNEVCEGDTLFLVSNSVNGLEPVIYSWTGPNGWTSNEENPIIPNISLADVGQYKLEATDGYGCDIIPDSVTVIVETAPTVNAGYDTTVCSADSVIPLNATIGGSAISAGWSGGSGTFSPDANTLDAIYIMSPAEISAGIARLILTTNDPGGECEPAKDTMVITIHESPIIDSVVTKEPLCNNVSDGTARVYVSGGASPYTYLWSTGHTTPSISNLGADTFWVQVTDANLCVVSDTFVIEEPDPFIISPTSPIVIPPSCYGADDGWAVVEVSGGIPPYRFNWDTNADPGGIYQDTAFYLPAGIYNVYVTDSAYCAASNIQVTVPQPPPPVLICPPDYEDVIGPDSCSITYDTIMDPYYNGFCDVTLTYTVTGATEASGTESVNGQVAFNVGQSFVKYVIDDGYNRDSCSFMVWVKHIDIPTPDVTCPELSPDPAYADADADCDADVTLDPPIYTDPCNEIDSIWNNSPATGATPTNASGTYPVGTTEFKWFVLDKSGNMDSSCVVQVVVLDTMKPTITCPSNALDSAAANNCSKTPGTLTDPTYGDLCSDVTLSWKMEGATTGIGLGTVTDSVFNVGLTTVTYYVEDEAGNRDSCSFTVQIVDITDPYISVGCESVSDTAAANLCSKVSAKLNDPVLNDNCWDTDSLILTWVMTGATTGSGNGSVKDSSFNVGVTTVTYTVSDPDGNWDECTFTVTIADIIDPEITIGCTSVADTLAPNECSKQSAQLVEPVLSDNCWDSDSLTLTWIMSGATTGSGVGSVTDSTFNIGVTTVTYTVTDPDGNSSDCSFTVTIAGVTEPGISLGCESFSDTLGVNDCYLISAKLKDPEFDNNCWPDSMLTLTWVMTGATTGSGDGSVKDSTFNVGVTHVIYTVTDPDGLFAICEFDVTILHIDIPTANFTCPQDTVWETPDAGNCDADVTLDALTYTDPCNEIDSVWNESPYRTSPSDASGTYPVGTTTFNWYITDISGNIDSCVVTVIVEDLLPTIDCPDSIVEFADFGEEYNSAVSLQDPVYGDNCPDPELTWWLIPPTGYETEYNSAELSGAGIYVSPDTFWLGVTTIWYKVVDSQGNADSCSFTITIEAAPDIDCPPDTIIYLDGSEDNCESTFDPGVPDLLEGVPPITWSFTVVFADGRPDSTGTYVSPAPGDALPMGDIDFPLGVTTILWRAENDAGYDTCSHWIEVIDTIPPILDADPYENCVDPLHWAVYDPANANPVFNHVDPNLEKFPVDYRTLFAGDEFLDLTSLEDNCCDSTDMTIHWRIEFSDTPDPVTGAAVSHPDITGTGQPSEYEIGGIPTDIYLWGDGVTFTSVTHQIFYWVEDCNGNTSEEIQESITITPRPQIIKENHE